MTCKILIFKWYLISCFSIKFKIVYLNEIFIKKNNETPLEAAIKKENIEIVKLLLTNKNINVNIINIWFDKFIKFYNIYKFNKIQN